MGTNTMDYRQLSQQIELKTGRFGASPHIAENHTDTSLYEEGVLFSSYCLDRNVEDMFQIWTDIFQRYISVTNHVISDADKFQIIYWCEVYVVQPAPVLSIWLYNACW